MDRINILGVGFDNLTKDEALEQCMKIARHSKGYVVTPNPEIVYRCRRDKEASRAVNCATLVVPDGIGVIYGAKLLGTPLRERIPGIDLAASVMECMNIDGMSLFLLGAKPGVAEKAAERLSKSYAKIRIVGTQDGYFKDDKAVIEKINKAQPDVIFVCLSSPRQEAWTAGNLSKLNTHLCMCLGGSLDVFSGNVERAPEIYQKLGLEWLHRLIKEPSRLGRMMVLPKFLLLTVKERFVRKK